jgi:hypothetical protein
MDERVVEALQRIAKALEKIATANIIHIGQRTGETNTPIAPIPPCPIPYQEPDGNTPPEGNPPNIYG